MKKILGLAFGLMLSALTFAQSHVTFNDAGASYDKAATTAFHFTFDSSFSLDDINTAGSYYTDYFTVSAEAAQGGFAVTVTLIENDEMARRVITRFLVSAKVENINADGADHSVDEFMGTYIML